MTSKPVLLVLNSLENSSNRAEFIAACSHRHLVLLLTLQNQQVKKQTVLLIIAKFYAFHISVNGSHDLRTVNSINQVYIIVLKQNVFIRIALPTNETT